MRCKMFSKTSKAKKSFIGAIGILLVLLMCSVLGALINANIGSISKPITGVWTSYTSKPAGNGTSETSPYKITQPQELAYLINNLGAGSWHIELVSDIDLSGHEWIPINVTAKNTVILKGNGFTIKNMKIDAVDKDYIGLFAGANTTVACNIIVNDVNFANVDIAGRDRVGCLIGHANTSCRVNNVNVLSGVIQGQQGCVGGIIGFNEATITDSSNAANVSMKNVDSGGKAGGIVGHDEAGSIIGCVNTGTVMGQRSTGGIVGEFFGNELKNCINTGDVINRGLYYVGGIAGALGDTTPVVDNCYAECRIILSNESNDYYEAGGIIGIVSSEANIKISNSGFYGEIIATGQINLINSIVGKVYNKNIILENCFSIVDININAEDLTLFSSFGFPTDKADYKSCYTYTRLKTTNGIKEYRKYKVKGEETESFSEFAYNSNINGGYPFPKTLFSVGQFIECDVLSYLQEYGFTTE